MKLRKRIKDIEKLKEEGNTAFKSGQLQEAVDKYGECLEVRPVSLKLERLSNHPYSESARQKRNVKVVKFVQLFFPIEPLPFSNSNDMKTH